MSYGEVNRNNLQHKVENLDSMLTISPEKRREFIILEVVAWALAFAFLAFGIYSVTYILSQRGIH